MFQKTVVLCVLILLSASVQSCYVTRDKYSHWKRIGFLDLPSPDSTLLAEHEPGWYEAEYQGYDAVYLERRLTEEHLGDLTRWRFLEVNKLRYMVLNPEADWVTTFRVSVEDEDQTIDSVYMTITTPEGKTSHFGKSELTVEQSGDGRTIYKFAYPDVRKGSMIEQGYIIRTEAGKRPLIREHFFEFMSRVPTEKVVYTYIYPADWVIRCKHIAEGEEAPTNYLTDEQSNGRALVVEKNNVGAWKDEPWSPYRLEVIPYVELSVSNAQTKKVYTEMPTSWSAANPKIRLHTSKFYPMRQNNKLKDAAQTISNEAKSDFEKISAITNWMQQNFEVGECIDCELDDIIHRGRGDVLSVLEITMALLDLVNISSRMIFIHPASEGYFDEYYVTYSEFLAPGVATITGSDTLVVFPYIKDLPAGLLPPAWQERPSIYLAVKNIMFLGTSPRGAVDENTEEEEYDLTIDEDGLISVREKKFFRGISAYLMRSALREAKESEMKDFMSELLTYEEGNVKLGEYNIENLDDYRQPLEITLNYAIDNLVTVTPEEVIFQTGGLFSPSSERKIKIETDERVNPIRIYADEEVIKRITINHPPEWKLETKLKPVEFNNQFGELNATYTSESGRFTAEQRRLLKKSSEPKEKIDDLMLITSRRSQLSIPTLIFAVKEK